MLCALCSCACRFCVLRILLFMCSVCSVYLCCVSFTFICLSFRVNGESGNSRYSAPPLSSLLIKRHLPPSTLSLFSLLLLLLYLCDFFASCSFLFCLLYSPFCLFSYANYCARFCSLSFVFVLIFLFTFCFCSAVLLLLFVLRALFVRVLCLCAVCSVYLLFLFCVCSVYWCCVCFLMLTILFVLSLPPSTLALFSLLLLLLFYLFVFFLSCLFLSFLFAAHSPVCV